MPWNIRNQSNRILLTLTIFNPRSHGIAVLRKLFLARDGKFLGNRRDIAMERTVQSALDRVISNVLCTDTTMSKLNLATRKKHQSNDLLMHFLCVFVIAGVELLLGMNFPAGSS